MIITREGDLERRVGLLDYLDSLAHRLHRAFVHRDGGLLEPALLFQVTGEIFQETAPIVGVGRLARFRVDEEHPVGRLVVIVERKLPRDHRIATDHLVDPDLVHHELHPFVEHGVIVSPRAVDFLDAGHHAIEMILGLAVPGFVHDAGRDGFLPGVRQHAHDGAHGLEVRLAPERHLVIAGHGVRVLP